MAALGATKKKLRKNDTKRGEKCSTFLVKKCEQNKNGKNQHMFTTSNCTL